VRYVTTGEVIQANEAEVGRGNVRDLGLLDSAVNRPKATALGEDAYSDLYTKAGAFMDSLVNNHPFVDGNKRTAALSVILFFNLNGYEVLADQGALVELATAVERGDLTVEQIGARLMRWTSKFVLPEEEDPPGT
jgi:death on curing protein